LHIIINDRQLSQVPSFKYLGVYIDENLTWQKHTRYVYQRVQSRLHCLYCLCPLSNALLGKLYCTFVLPILDYCDVVWSPSSVQYFKRFERIHSKFCSLTLATQSFLQHTVQLSYNFRHAWHSTRSNMKDLPYKLLFARGATHVIL